MTTAKKNNAVTAFVAGFLSLTLLSFATLAQDTPENVPESAAAADNVSHDIAVLRALDKITARITELDVQVGQEVQFGTLALTAKYCRTRPPIEPPETFAYLEIDDIKRAGTRELMFEGWMIASSPALNPLEHPVYDVWVINCRTASPGADTGSE